MTTIKLIKLARKHLCALACPPARFHLDAAIALHTEGQFRAARYRALASLAYSVGILHPDYRRAAEAFQTAFDRDYRRAAKALKEVK